MQHNSVKTTPREAPAPTKIAKRTQSGNKIATASVWADGALSRFLAKLFPNFSHYIEDVDVFQTISGNEDRSNAAQLSENHTARRPVHTKITKRTHGGNKIATASVLASGDTNENR